MPTTFIYSHKYDPGEYSSDPAADRTRFDTISAHFRENPEYIEPEPANLDDILRVHSQSHVDWVQRDPYLHEMACLAAGGAIKAAGIAMEGKAVFGVIRPPGHHASERNAWGFCFYNNMAIALKKLLSEGKIRSAFILDFDLHTGDGNINILSSIPGIEIYNPDGVNSSQYINRVKDKFKQIGEVDVFAASAGFDQYEEDWGGLLSTEDFWTLGRLSKEFALNKCKGRRFAILEGGYNYKDLWKNIAAFCDGFS